MSRSAKPSLPPAPSAILIAPLKRDANLPKAVAQLASADNPSAVLGCDKPSRNGVSTPLTVEQRGAGAVAYLAEQAEWVDLVHNAPAQELQWKLARVIANERVPTEMRLKAQVASILNQLRDR